MSLLFAFYRWWQQVQITLNATRVPKNVVHMNQLHKNDRIDKNLGYSLLLYEHSSLSRFSIVAV